jgi:hypothetical protein
VGFWVMIGLLTALILARYAVSARDRRRRARLRRLAGEDAAWWDGRTDVYRYDRHHWGGWWP